MGKLPHLALPVAEAQQNDVNTHASGAIGFVKREKSTMGFRELRNWMGEARPWGSHSVPSRIAHLLVLDNAAHECANKMMEYVQSETNWNPMLDGWLGSLCIYLLHEKLGLRIQFEHDDIEPWENGEKPEDADERVHAQQAIIKDLRAAGRHPCNPEGQQARELWRLTRLSVIKEGRRYPFALLDEQLLLCPIPLNRETQQLFSSGLIPWHSSSNNVSDWSGVHTYLLRENRGMYGKLVYRLLRRLEGQIPYSAEDKPKKYIQMLARYLELAGNFDQYEDFDQAGRTYKQLSLEERTHLPGEPPTGMVEFLELPPNSETPSIEVTFTENAVLLPLTNVQRDSLAEHFLCSPIEVPNIGGTDGSKLYLLPPVHEEIYKFLDKCHGSIHLSLRYTVDLEVDVSIQFQDEDGIPQNRSKRYSLRGNTLWLLESLPYLSLWPNVNLPADAWKLYFVVKAGSAIGRQPLANLINAAVSNEQTRKDLQLIYYQDSPQYLSADKIRLRVDGHKGKTVSSAINNAPWTLYQTETRPSLIGIYGGSDGQHHLANLRLLQKESPVSIIQDKRMNVSIDFGTSATMMYIDGSGGPRSIFSGHDKVLDLVPYEQDEMKRVFERFHGILPGQDGLLGKVNSVAQINDINQFIDRDAIQPYLQGRYIQMDAQVWARFMPEGDNRALHALNLSDYGVYAGLKFPVKAADATKVEDALFVFFGNLLALAALDARLAGAQRVQLFAACPHAIAYNNLTSFLQVAMNQMNTHYFGGLFEESLQIYAESDAVRAYLQHFKDREGSLHLESGAVIVDIGGGTTDICAMKGNTIRKTSFGLAGDRLVRRSMIYSTVKDPPKGSVPQTLSPGLKELRKFLAEPLSEDEVKVQERFLKAYEWHIMNGKQRECLRFPTSGNKEEKKYPALAELLDTLMQNFPPAYEKITLKGTLEPGKTGDTTPVQSLRCLSEIVKLRYMLLFYLIASFLKHNEEDLQIKQMETIRIYFAGLGSRGLGFCCGQSINAGREGCAGTPFMKVLERIIQKVLEVDKRVIFIMPQDEDKVEVVTGLLAGERVLGEEMAPLPEFPEGQNPADRAALVEKSKVEAENIAKLFDAVFNEIIAEGVANREWQRLKPFCTSFVGLLHKCKAYVQLASGSFAEDDMMNKAIVDSHAAMLLGEEEVVGLAVWYYNDLLDIATRRWGDKA